MEIAIFATAVLNRRTDILFYTDLLDDKTCNGVSRRCTFKPNCQKLRPSCGLRLTCSLVCLDFLEASKCSQRPALFKGHNRNHVLLVVQPQLDVVFGGAVVHRLCVFLRLGLIWQNTRWYRFLCLNRFN